MSVPPAAREVATGGRPLDVLHLDMDCFFAAVEVQRDPSLAGKPVVVGGTGERGVVASASYEARVFGVRSAMPTAVARRLCPSAVFLPARFDAYTDASRRLHDLLLAVTPVVEPVALDEAYLDLAGAHRLLGSSLVIAGRLRAAVEEELELECAVGVGSSKLVAKLASKAAKPRVGPDGVEPGRGVVVVEVADEVAFLHAHPVRALPGVGPRTADRLRRYGVSTVGDLAAVSRESLERLLGVAAGRALHDLAWARDDRPVVADRATRSIGHEETYPEDLHDLADLARRARGYAASVARRCRDSGVGARTVTVKVRYGDFSTVTRSRTLERAVSSAAAIGDAACELLSSLPVNRGVRLLGVHASGLAAADAAAPDQLALFVADDRGAFVPAEPDARDDVEAATEAIRRRYGSEAIGSLGDRARGPDRRGFAGPNAPG